MPAVAKILDLLSRRIGMPQSVVEIAQAIPGVDATEIEAACNRLRDQGKLGRDGAGTPDRPYRFYLKGQAVSGLYRYETAPGRWWASCCGEDGRRVNIIRNRYEQMGIEPSFLELPIKTDGSNGKSKKVA